MELFEAIQKRHSYRGGFTDAPVPREDLVRIVNAGLAAPSGCNAQTTSFVVVDDPGRMAAINEVMDKPVVATAKAIVVCLMNDLPVYQGKAFGVEDCAAAVENILLAVTALGYATVWLDGVLRTEGRAERIAELLGVPSPLQVRIILPIGVPEKARSQPEKKPFEARAWFNAYGAEGE